MDVDSGEVVAAPAEAVDPIEVSGGDGGSGGGGGSNSGEEDKGLLLFEDGEKNFGGNRWPRQETLALLKIRSDMDAVFRDATHKAPLWDEVSRKLGELGFNRTPKKCKEKFENVYKYHKRTKEGRTGNSDNSKKNYRFSDELEAFNSHHHDHISFQSHHHHNHQPQLPPVPLPTMTLKPPPPPAKIKTSTVPSTMNTRNNNSMPPKSSKPLSNLSNMAASVMFSSSTSSSTASEEDPFRNRRKRRKKRKWSDFFVRLTKEVIEKQEGLQLKFLEALERIENQRKLRDDAWRMKEMTRVNQEHEVLVQEMSTAAAKDAAVVAFLQKLAPSPSLSPPPPQPSAQPQKGENGKMTTAMIIRHLSTQPEINNGENGKMTSVTNSHLSTQPQNIEKNHEKAMSAAGSPSRWPKAEVEALIRLRTEMEMKYQENGPKGLLWEEISAAMRGVGYNRSSKRCKEKWENINKYFKKVKDSNKKRPEDSKTCPYFHQLDALYREKEKNISFDINSQMEPLMVEPEQQWPPPFQANQMMGNLQRINGEGNQDQEDEEEEEDHGGSSSTDVEN